MKAVVRTCACAFSLDHLDFRQLCMAHIVKIRMHSLSVLFRYGSSHYYFLTKLFEFAAYANSLDHLDCSNNALAVFFNKKFISGSKFLFASMKAVVRSCLFVISHDHLDYQIVIYGSLIRNQDEFTLRFIETEVRLPIVQGSCLNFELIKFS